MRIIATLIIIIGCGLPAVFAGWPANAPAFFASLPGGVPGSILAMSLLLLAFVVIAALSSGVARRASAGDQEAGR